MFFNLGSPNISVVHKNGGFPEPYFQDIWRDGKNPVSISRTNTAYIDEDSSILGTVPEMSGDTCDKPNNATFVLIDVTPQKN